MFYGASAFNQNVGGWNTASVSEMSQVCLAHFAPAGIGRGPIGLRR